MALCPVVRTRASERGESSTQLRAFYLREQQVVGKETAKEMREGGGWKVGGMGDVQGNSAYTCERVRQAEP